jgi:epoxyqueuosine reductase
MKKENTIFLKQKAFELGFEFAGISVATELTEEAKQLEKWLNKGYHGEMAYMENHFEKRIDPRKLVDGAKSVVSLLYNYHNPEKQQDGDAPLMSQYAYGEDYHHVVKVKLKALLDALQEKIGTISGRCFVDSAPVMEREWAKRSGNGWIGKNTLLIHPRRGSYFFLAELILDIELEPDGPIKDYCGTCTRCIDACPTEAIAPSGYLLDASRCISYLTIELQEAIPEEFRGKMGNWMFGCDICQEVCPWNRFSRRHHEPAFEPQPQLLQMSKKEWQEMNRELFGKLFAKSAVKRTKFEGLSRNIAFLE